MDVDDYTNGENETPAADEGIGLEDFMLDSVMGDDMTEEEINTIAAYLVCRRGSSNSSGYLQVYNLFNGPSFDERGVFQLPGHGREIRRNSERVVGYHGEAEGAGLDVWNIICWGWFGCSHRGAY